MKTITYKHLWDYFRHRNKQLGSQNEKVYLSNLKKFAEFFGKTLESPVEDELYARDKTDLFFGWAEGVYSADTIPALKTKLNRLREAYLLLSIEQNVTDTSFGATLEYLISRSGLSVPKFAEEIGLPFVTVYRWINGTAAPNAGHLVEVEKIERRFGLPVGTLRQKLGKIVFGQKQVMDSIASQTTYGKDIARLKKLPYALSFDLWPERLRADFEEMKSFYTTKVLPGNLQWFKRRYDQRWREDETGCDAADRVRQLYERFFGFLTLSTNSANPELSGLGVPVDRLSLTLLINPELLLEYMRFREVRHGKVTTGTDDVFKTARAFIVVKFGYLRQRDDLGRKYSELRPDGQLHPMLADEDPRAWKIRWTEICDESLDRIDTLRQSTEFVPFRDIKEPLRPILNSGDIYGEIKNIFRTMKTDADMKGVTPGERAVRFRDYLLVVFHYLLVLRCEHYSQMTLGRHLVQTAPDQWVLNVYRNELKRPEILDDEVLKIELPGDVSRWITEYVTKHRPVLRGCGDYFFLPSKNSNAHSREEGWLTPDSVSRIFRQNMARYSPCPTGFGSHGVRKIVSSILDRKRDLVDSLRAGWWR